MTPQPEFGATQCRHPWAPHPSHAEFARCGTCSGCRKQRFYDWRSRLLLESAYGGLHPTFVTLTYRDEDLPETQAEATEALQRFWKRYRRKRLSPRYFVATEYGERFGRIHHHAIVWEPVLEELAQFDSAKVFLEECWTHGYVDASRCRSPRALGYAIKYLQKGVLAQWSRRPVLGQAGLEAWAGLVSAQHRRQPYRSIGEVPSRIYTNVLGEAKMVSIPQAAFLRHCRGLGVPYAPDSPLETMMRVQFSGVPNGPLRIDIKDYINDHRAAEPATFHVEHSTWLQQSTDEELHG